MNNEDTIAAISTSAGEAGIGIVRISGPDALGIAARIFVSPKGKAGGFKSHTVYYGYIKDPKSGERLDEVLLTIMKAPRSFTKEDVVEINCHGGFTPLRRVLELALREGARLAAPGEFTKRAFLNGRIDLSQAEAVLDLVRAKTEKAENIALEQLSGALSARVNALREKLIAICANIEAHIDFPEEEIEPSSLEEIKTGMGQAVAEISSLIKGYDEGKFFREGLKVVIAGRPNVGKSSLLNALLKKDRAIVTEMPGTTRDVIEEYLNIDGLPLRVMDTAGIRQSHDLAEKEGVKRTLLAIEEADLIIGVLDGSGPLTPADTELVEKAKGRKAVFVINKSDLPRKLQADKNDFILLSAKTGEGMDTLKKKIFETAITGGTGEDVTPLVTNIRHKNALEASVGALNSALRSLDAAPIEITAIEMREALSALGEIVGAVTTDEILDRIFSDFCIGK